MKRMNLEPRIKDEIERIEQIKESRYCTRSELMEMINFPPNSANLVVIKSNDKGIGFLKTQYDARYCAGVINKDEFDAIIERASNLMGGVYSKKRKMDSQGVPLWYKLTLLFSVLVALVFLIMAYYLPENDLWYQVLTFALLGVSLTLVSLISLINFCKRTDRIETYDEMILEKIGNYFKQLNETKFHARNMEWFLVPGHYWLELRINKRQNNFVRETEGNNYYSTNLETQENRNSRTKATGKKEELKTEGPLNKDHSIDGRLSELIRNPSEDDS